MRWYVTCHPSSHGLGSNEDGRNTPGWVVSCNSCPQNGRQRNKDLLCKDCIDNWSFLKCWMPRCVCFQHKLRILLITYEGSENITTTLVQTENWCRPSNHAFNSHICFKVGHSPKEATVIHLISELSSKIHLPFLHPPLSHAPWQIKVIGIRSSKPTDAQIFIPHRCSNFWRDNVTTSIRWTPHETPRDGGLFKGERLFL